MNTNGRILVWCLFGLTFVPFLSLAQDCSTCKRFPVICNPNETPGAQDGVMTQVFGVDGNGCRTVTIDCQDDAKSNPLAYMETPDEQFLFFPGDTLTCGADGTWFGGVTADELDCNVDEFTVVAEPTCEVIITTTTSTTTSTTSTTTSTTTTPTTTSTTSTTTTPTTTSTTTSTTSTTTTEAPCCEEWSAWMSSTPCGDSCGGCSNSTFTRTCLTAATCPCVGASSKNDFCNRPPCTYPRNSCCGTLKAKSVSSYILCYGPTETQEVPPQTCNCCPEQGIWSSWNENSCSDTCGGYGTGNKWRTCLSAGMGCPCTGNPTEVGKCKMAPCSYPRASCATGLKATAVNGVITCVNASDAVTPTTCCPTEGLWNPWGPWTNCTTTCGGCSNASRTRVCASKAYGCPCTGSATESAPCNRVACTTGKACCVGTVKSVSGQNVCQS